MTDETRLQELAVYLRDYLFTSKVCYQNKLKVYANVPIAFIVAENPTETNHYQHSKKQIEVLVCKQNEILLAIEFVDELGKMKRTHAPTMQFLLDKLDMKTVETVESWLEERLKSDTKSRQIFMPPNYGKNDRIPLRIRLSTLRIEGFGGNTNAEK